MNTTEKDTGTSGNTAGNNSFSALFRSFRESGLSLKDSLYNSLYISFFEKAEKKEMPLKKEYENICSHPSGWYSDSRETKKKSFAGRVVSLLEKLPKKEKHSESQTESEKKKISVLSVVKNIFPYAAPVVCGAAAFLVISSHFPLNIDLVAYVDGKELGFIEAKEDIDSVVGEIEESASEVLGYAFKYPRSITYDVKVRNNKENFTTGSEIRKCLSSCMDEYIREGHGIYVDGVLVGANKDESVLKKAVEEAVEIERELNPGSLNVSLNNSIEYTFEEFPVSKFVSEGYIVNILCGGASSVSSFDDVLTEQLKSGMLLTSYGREDESTEKQPKSLSAYYLTDEEESVITTSFTVTREEETTEEIPFETIYVDDPEAFVGEQTVTTEGRIGSMRIISQVTYSDGIEISRVITNKYIVEDKIDEVIKIGTKLLPENDPEKTKKPFYSPLGTDVIYITSAFGGRYIFGSWSYHYGLDLKADMGTPVYASMSGEITNIVKGHSSYGNYIEILHPNGMTSIYAHLGDKYDKKITGIACEIGQTVEQGELIGYSGMTGRATGPHLHFELRLANGERVDPRMYLDVKKYNYTY